MRVKRVRKILVTNKTETLTKNVFNNVTLNLKADKAKTRYNTLNGKQYLVVPCVMINEGVHVGSMGSLFYPEEELAKRPVVWNKKPVVVYHPEFNGNSISACDPEVIESQSIGELFNTRWEDGDLKTECWLDEEKTKEVDNRILEAIENSEMMEVSTGLFTENEMTEGDWNGKHYDAIARNYGPDHLAILPDLKGACSIEDGAGLLRNAEKLTGAEKLLADDLANVFNELSHSELWEKLNDKIRTSKDSNKWVRDVYDNFFIYDEGDKDYYQEYEIDDNDEVKLIGIRKEAERVTQYVLTDGTVVGNKELTEKSGISNNSIHKENKMDREKMINELIANEESPWSEEDREKMNTFSDEQLASMASEEEAPEENESKKRKVKKVTKKEEAPEENEEEESEEGKGKKTKPAENKEVTVAEHIANLPAEVQDMVVVGLNAHNAQKGELIQKIMANEKNEFTEEMLQAKKLGELAALARLAEVSQPNPQPAVPFFAGMGEPLSNTNKDEEPLVMPVMNFGTEE